MAGSSLPLPAVPPRRSGRTRDRRGRGRRGPLALPGPLTESGCPLARSRAERFDELVLAAVDRIEGRWQDQLLAVEFGVEDTPPVDDSWAGRPVPLGALVLGTGAEPPRIVLFRRPVELRAESTDELAALVHDVLVEQVAELLGRSPEDVDPG
jgi:predicted Zn-dependent protease with MMP-like domain